MGESFLQQSLAPQDSMVVPPALLHPRGGGNQETQDGGSSDADAGGRGGGRGDLPRDNRRRFPPGADLHLDPG